MSQLDGGPGNRHTNWIFMSKQTSKSTKYIDPDFEGLSDEEPEDLLPDLPGVECIVSSLITQGLLNGFLSHSRSKFAIQGAKKKGGPLKAGFPNVWEVVSARSDAEVPGWKKEEAPVGRKFGSGMAGPSSDFGPGTVVNLSGVRPVGSGL